MEKKYNLKEELYKIGLNINDFDFLQIIIIKMGFEDDVNVSFYAFPQFEWRQMYEIFIGLKFIKDEKKIQIYAHPDFNYLQMHLLFQGLLFDIDVLEYNNPDLSVNEMKEKFKKLYYIKHGGEKNVQDNRWRLFKRRV